MDFSFHYKVRPVNLWVLSMINIYRSMIGVVNIVFTASMVLLIIRFWLESSWIFRILMIAGILVFPVIQPLMIFLRSRKIIRGLPLNMRMDFDSKGIRISAEKMDSLVPYEDLKSVIQISGMLILYTQSKQGFILDKEILQDKGAKLYQYLTKKLRK